MFQVLLYPSGVIKALRVHFYVRLSCKYLNISTVPFVLRNCNVLEITTGSDSIIDFYNQARYSSVCVYAYVSVCVCVCMKESVWLQMMMISLQ